MGCSRNFKGHAFNPELQLGLLLVVEGTLGFPCRHVCLCRWGSHKATKLGKGAIGVLKL